MYQLLRKTLFLGEAKGDKEIPFIITLFFEQCGKNCSKLIVFNNGKFKYVQDDFYLGTIIDDVLPRVVGRLVKVNSEIYHDPDYKRKIIKELKWARSFIYVGTGIDLIGGDFDYILKVGVNEFINSLVKISRDIFDWKYKGIISQPLKPDEEITVAGPFNDKYDPKKEEVKLLSVPMLMYIEVLSDERGEFYVHFQVADSKSKILLNRERALPFMTTFVEALHDLPKKGECQKTYTMSPISDWDAGTSALFCRSDKNSGFMAFNFNESDLIFIPDNDDVKEELIVLLGITIGRYVHSNQSTKEKSL